jgi:hypothetical protein
MMKGYTVNILNLSDNILVYMMNYLSPKEKIKYQLVCKDIRKNMVHPS